MRFFEANQSQGKVFEGNGDVKSISPKEIWEAFQVNRMANKLLGVASPAISSVYLKAGENSSMAFNNAKEIILELDSERVVPGTEIYGLEIEYALSMEDLDDHSQYIFRTWGKGGRRHSLYFQQVGTGKIKLAKISQDNSQGDMSYMEQKKVLSDVIGAVKYANSRKIINQSG